MSAPLDSISCETVDERLLDYLYEELPDGERAQLEAHIEGCPRCAAEIAAFRRVRQAARSLPVVEPSPQITSRLLEAAAGRNVVPLPLRAAASSTDGAVMAGGGAEPSQAATDRILAAARAQVSAAAPAKASASAGAVPITAARRRRWLAHPGFAAAASFVVVGIGTMWFLSTNREAMMAPQVAMSPSAQSEAQGAAEPATIEAAEGANVEATKNTIDIRNGAKSVPAKAPAPSTVAAIEPAPELKAKGAAFGDAVARDERSLALGKSKAEASRAPASPLGAAFERGMGTAGHGAGGGGVAAADDGYLEGGVAQGRGSGQPVGMPSPSPARAPGGKGVSLHPDENATLEKSVEVARESAKKRDGAGVDKRTADAEEAYAAAPPPKAAHADRAWAAPPPPPPAAYASGAAPSTPAAATGGSVARRAEAPSDRDDALGSDSPAANGQQRSRAVNKQSAQVAFQDAKRLSCNEFLDAYRELRSAEPGHAFTPTERMQVARCYGDMGQTEQARAEYDSLRASHPELAAKIDAALQAQRSQNIERDQVAQRKAATEAPAAAAPAKAKPARAKTGKAAADTAATY